MTTTTTAPAIVCPGWCERTPDEHVSELHAWEGLCLHVGHFGGDDFEVGLGISLHPDGTADDRHQLGLVVEGRDVDLERAERMAHALLEAVATARAVRSEMGL